MNLSLQQGIAALRAGKPDEARNFFIAAVKQDPQSEQSWGWLYNAANSDKERMDCLKQILRINPGNEKAKQLLEALNNPTLHPLSSDADAIKGQSIASPPGAAGQSPAKESENAKKPRMTTGVHLFFYAALYTVGGIVAVEIGILISLMLTRLQIIQTPTGGLIYVGLFVIGAFSSSLVFAKTVPAICPACGGAAFLKWPSRPVTYICSECAHIHQTKFYPRL